MPIGVFGLTFNTTANATVQLATDPVMRGRVMSLYMMVFVGGTPIGGPVMGWVTDTYGARVGFMSGGLVSAAAAVGVGLVLARAGGLRVRVNWRRPATRAGRWSTSCPRDGGAGPGRRRGTRHRGRQRRRAGRGARRPARATGSTSAA